MKVDIVYSKSKNNDLTYAIFFKKKDPKDIFAVHIHMSVRQDNRLFLVILVIKLILYT